MLPLAPSAAGKCLQWGVSNSDRPLQPGSAMRTGCTVVLVAWAAIAALACAPIAEGEEGALGASLDGFEDDFDPHYLASDRAFFDTTAVDAAAVQTFLENPPYPRPSVLATQVMADGRTFAEALVDISVAHGLNPLVLLVQTQKESSLVSKCSATTAGCTDPPSQFRLDYAFGCGCPDGQGCSPQFRGLDKQMECIAKSFENHHEALIDNGQTLTGWKPGKAKNTLDPIAVNPGNRATAILYTYTPWVLQGSGGNWAFWSIWTKFSRALDYQDGLVPPFNEGYIGGACVTSSDCFFADAECIAGRCTRDCSNLCPDRPGSIYATTFCITAADGQGTCVARCPDGTCGTGQECAARSRHSDPASTASVCLAN